MLAYLCGDAPTFVKCDIVYAERSAFECSCTVIACAFCVSANVCLCIVNITIFPCAYGQQTRPSLALLWLCNPEDALQSRAGVMVIGDSQRLVGWCSVRPVRFLSQTRTLEGRSYCFLHRPWTRGVRECLSDSHYREPRHHSDTASVGKTHQYNELTQTQTHQAKNEF